MNGKIRYGNSVIKYHVIQSARRKTSEIIVDKKGVMVRTPKNKPMSEIQNIVKGKGRWIFNKQLEFESRPVQVLKTKKYTQRFLLERISFYSKKVGVVPKKVTIKNMSTRWGSASKDNVINLNKYLLKAPKGAIDYVILHEICHLKVRNHSHKFWKLVRKYMPNYLENRGWLEANSTRIVE